MTQSYDLYLHLCRINTVKKKMTICKKDGSQPHQDYTFLFQGKEYVFF